MALPKGEVTDVVAVGLRPAAAAASRSRTDEKKAMSRLAKVLDVEWQGFNLRRGAVVAVVLGLLIVVGVLPHDRRYFVAAIFGALMVGVSDPGGKYGGAPCRARRQRHATPTPVPRQRPNGIIQRRRVRIRRDAAGSRPRAWVNACLNSRMAQR